MVKKLIGFICAMFITSALFSSENWYHYTYHKNELFISVDFQLSSQNELYTAKPIWINLHGHNLTPNDKVEIEWRHVPYNHLKKMSNDTSSITYTFRLNYQDSGHFAGQLQNERAISELPIALLTHEVIAYKAEVAIKINGIYLTTSRTLKTEESIFLYDFIIQQMSGR